MNSKLGQLDVVYALMEEIDLHPDNANVGNIAAIEESIKINGFYAPLIVQSSTGYILAGNHRYRAARNLGYTQVPVVYVDVDDAEAKRIMIVDNRTTRLGHDDTDALTKILEELGDSEVGLMGTGYTHAELQTLLDAQDTFADELLNEPDPVEHDASAGQYMVEAIPGAGGTCAGVMVNRFDHEPLTPEDFNKIRVMLGLGRAARGAIATAGIEDWV